jgi:hypothetical protein
MLESNFVISPKNGYSQKTSHFTSEKTLPCMQRDMNKAVHCNSEGNDKNKNGKRKEFTCHPREIC